jgi:hypothetical protein
MEVELSIGKTEPIVIAVPSGQSSLVSSQIEYRDALVARVQKKGEIVAKMKLKTRQRELSRYQIWEALRSLSSKLQSLGELGMH